MAEEKDLKNTQEGENFPPSSEDDILDQILSEGKGATSDEEKEEDVSQKEEGEEAPKLSIEVPEKFKTKDGKVDLERLVKSYTELEKELHARSQRLSEYEKLVTQLLQNQAAPQQTPQAEQSKEEEEEDLAELLLSEPQKALDKIKEKVRQEISQEVQAQILQSLYRSIPPEDRVSRIVASSYNALPEEERLRIEKNREKYEKVYESLMKRIGPERIESYLLQYAQQNIPPVKFFIDIADAIEEAIRARENEIRETEKKRQEHVSTVKSSPPPEHRTEESLEKVADEVIKELGLF